MRLSDDASRPASLAVKPKGQPCADDQRDQDRSLAEASLTVD